MAQWDIKPAGVKGVLVKAETSATSLSDAITSFGGDLESCAGAIGQSIVAKALSDFVQGRSAELSQMGTHISTAMKGTISAVNAYTQGNIEMAANAQTTAAQAAPPTFSGAAGGRRAVMQ